MKRGRDESLVVNPGRASAFGDVEQLVLRSSTWGLRKSSSRLEEEQQIAVLGEVVVVAESLVKGSRSGRRGRRSSWCWLVVR